MPRFLLSLLLLLFCAPLSQAQLLVDLQIKRRLFIAYEPIVATVTIRNLSGRDLPLEDEPGRPWFSFQIQKDHRSILPLDADYKLNPVIIPAGESIQRKLLINTLYSLSDYGLYRLRATVYFGAIDKYFQSSQATVEITDGKPIWQQTIGVPDGQENAGATRHVSLLSFRKVKHTELYVRVQDTETGAVFCTQPIGRYITGVEPEVQLDRQNCIHILHLNGPKLFLHTLIGPNGEFISQQTYLAEPYRPTLRIRKHGDVAIRGGVLQTPENRRNELGVTAAPNIPKLSDRPVIVPKD